MSEFWLMIGTVFLVLAALGLLLALL